MPDPKSSSGHSVYTLLSEVKAIQATIHLWSDIEVAFLIKNIALCDMYEKTFYFAVGPYM